MEIQKNISLKNFNSFGLNAKAKLFCNVTTTKELQEVLNSDIARKNQLFILGGGSNVLLTKDFDGLVVKISIKGVAVIDEDDTSVVVKIGAGENWHKFVLQAIKQNWGGVENLSLIPGTVGAAPMQNIGAYGVEIKEVFEYLLALDKQSLEIKQFNNQECQFGYRESIFKNVARDRYVITEVVLRLSKNNHKVNTTYGAIENTLNEMGIENPTIQDVSMAVISIRQSKLPDPAEIGNAGSFFKNPTIDKIDYEGLKAEYPTIPGYELPDSQVKVPAAWLIEQCEWKGLERNGIGVHKKQALVLVNYGNGSGEDIKKLAFEIQDSVARKFGIELSPEVNII